MSGQLYELTAVELVQGIGARDFSPLDVVDSVLDHIDRHNGPINAFITRTPELARAAARRAQEVLAHEGPAALGPLAGIPVSIKDMTATAGVRTTAGVKSLENEVPTDDAPVAQRIRAAGAALVGKSSLPAYAWLGVTENELVGRTNNPWALDRSVGGSSGGAAAAIAGGFGPLATGSDGGGSIRVPSSLCGVVGLKPSHGRIPRGAESPGFDTVDALGPITRTVADAALLLGVIAGPHPGEPYMLPHEDTDYLEGFTPEEARGLRVAYSPDMGNGPVDPEVAAIVESAARHFETVLGAAVEVSPLTLPDVLEYFLVGYGPTVRGFATSDPDFLAAHLNRYPGLQPLVDYKRDLSLDDWFAYTSATREETFSAITAVFDDHDVLLTPTMPVAAWPHDGERGPREVAGQPVAWPALDFYRFTEPTGHSGHPSITVPCGFTSAGLPVGLQIIGPQRDDRGVLRAAAAFEATTPWHQQRPKLPTN